MVKAFAYIRVSGRGQINGDGFERQSLAIKKHAAANGIKIVNWFREEGVSGAVENMDRPAWRDLMAALHSNGFDLVSAQEPDLMASDPTRVLMRQMLGAFAQYDKNQIVSKLRGARMRKKAQTGRCEGRKPFGRYDGENAAITRMKQLRSEGLGFDRIAIKLSAEHVPTRTGKPWHGFVVNGILSHA